MLTHLGWLELRAKGWGELKAIPLSHRATVLYLFVRDVHYPRNSRMRAYLESKYEAQITVVDTPVGATRLQRYWRATRAIVKQRRRYDLVVLSEFNMQYFPLSWLAARAFGAFHLVDFFVGLHETEVGDAKVTKRRSLRAYILRWTDRAAISSSDACLTDTVIRADRFSRLVSMRRRVFPLPVGAPTWARPVADTDPQRERSSRTPVLLYYGSYLALHGLDAFVRAVALLGRQDVKVQMIGSGPCEPAVRRLVETLRLDALFHFIPDVPAEELSEYVKACDVVVGIFGESDKAREVIANKVWQGLYMGKHVITRSSPALDELAAAAEGLLYQVTSDAEGIREGLETILEQVQGAGSVEPDRSLYVALEEYVATRYDAAFTPLQRGPGR